ncbi:MAG: hypothetical protein ABS88_01115 [Sphingopyxis sp. SCN 67-31]|nr:MAG: hypothetical protein ABS88_01115 [Sphingopyxis sp. SCN 67-31]
MTRIDTAGRPVRGEGRLAAAPARFCALPRILLQFEEQVLQQCARIRVERPQLGNRRQCEDRIADLRAIRAYGYPLGDDEGVGHGGLLDLQEL